MVCLGRPYHLKFFKGCLSQILLIPFLNTLTQMFDWILNTPLLDILLSAYQIYLQQESRTSIFKVFKFSMNFYVKIVNSYKFYRVGNTKNMSMGVCSNQCFKRPAFADVLQNRCS